MNSTTAVKKKIRMAIKHVVYLYLPKIMSSQSLLTVGLIDPNKVFRPIFTPGTEKVNNKVVNHGIDRMSYTN